MRINVVCPVTQNPITEYEFEMNISNVLDRHMAEHHSDWYKVKRFEYLPKGAVQCPICNIPFASAKSIDFHVARSHTDYKKTDTLHYVLRNKLEETRAARRIVPASKESRKQAT